MQLNVRNRREEWFEVYPVAERLRSATNRSFVLIVDIRGGVGHDLTAFATRYTDLSGRLVLQDVPAVISTIPTDPPLLSHIEVMPHDFFQPQPIQGARVYYMRTVLHDWPDIEAEKILSNTVAAMDTQSVLLISEKIMPASNTPASLVQADISMMVQFSALERTKQQWIVLLEKVELQVTGCWESKEAGDGQRTLFEARLLN
jgi:O-methyltransferase domain